MPLTNPIIFYFIFFSASNCLREVFNFIKLGHMKLSTYTAALKTKEKIGSYLGIQPLNAH